ncbi:MAG TPA: carboxymuconolactone decarboxylase family protein [Spirochaeta sp.]|nr:carboxymuconolactone decarboxylase family protein [Spirochaeta sp.]
MRMLEQFFPEFTEKLDEIDKIYEDKRLIDEKTYQFICFSLSIKARSKPCVLKHFKGALEAGATVKELSYIFALVMREAAGADDCWTHDVLGDWKEILAGNVKCDCES